MRIRLAVPTITAFAAAVTTVVVSGCTNTPDEPKEFTSTISASTRPSPPVYGGPENDVTFTGDTWSMKIHVTYEGKATEVVVTNGGDQRLGANFTDIRTGKTTICTSAQRTCTFADGLEWTSVTFGDKLAQTESMPNPYNGAGDLTHGITFNPDTKTYSFLLERTTSTVRVLLNNQGDLIGLRFLETDKNFRFTINRTEGLAISCFSDLCQIWNKDSADSDKIGTFDDNNVTFDKPIEWTSLLSSDASAEDKPFKRSSFKLVK